MFREHFQSVLKRLRTNWSHDQLMVGILREWEEAPAPLQPKERQWNGLSREEYKWMGKKVKPKEQMEMCRGDLKREALYDGFEVTRDQSEATLAIWLGYNYQKRAAEYERYVKLSNGTWFTLNEGCYMKKAEPKPRKGERWMFFKQADTTTPTQVA